MSSRSTPMKGRSDTEKKGKIKGWLSEAAGYYSMLTLLETGEGTAGLEKS